MSLRSGFTPSELSEKLTAHEIKLLLHEQRKQRLEADKDDERIAWLIYHVGLMLGLKNADPVMFLQNRESIDKPKKQMTDEEWDDEIEKQNKALMNIYKDVKIG